MLSNITASHPESLSQDSLDKINERFKRNEEADMVIALSHLYEFKRQLDRLHPKCISFIEHILQNKVVRY